MDVTSLDVIFKNILSEISEMRVIFKVVSSIRWLISARY